MVTMRPQPAASIAGRTARAQASAPRTWTASIALPLAVARLEERALAGHAGVVDEDERRTGGVGEAATTCATRSASVTSAGSAIGATAVGLDGRDRVLEAGRHEVEAAHHRALGGQAPGHGASDAARGAGHERDAAGEGKRIGMHGPSVACPGPLVTTGRVRRCGGGRRPVALSSPAERCRSGLTERS